MKYQKLALTAIAGATTIMLTTPPASASAATATATATASAKAAAKQRHTYASIKTSKWQKKEDEWGSLHTTQNGKVRLGLLSKERNHAVGLRLISCKSHKGLTGWAQMKKKVDWKNPGLYTLSPALKKNTCFIIQAGRSQAGDISIRVWY